MKKIETLELFSGAGGLALGLEQAGLTLKSCLDYDKNSCQTLKINRPHWHIINEDINVFAQQNLKKYQNIDLISGGFPCQPFSSAGKGNGFKDTRANSFFNFIEIIQKTRPKMILMENVRGILTNNKGETLKTIIACLEKNNYKIKYQLLNAWDYQVAQKRKRVFFIGIRKDLNLTFDFPKPITSRLVLKDILQDVPISNDIRYSMKKEKIFALIPQGGCHRHLPINIAKEYMGKSYYTSGGKTGIARRLSWDEPSLTLLTSPQQKQTERCHPEETRPLTIREYARIQSFPDEWQFFGSVSSIYRQIGNAVPVNLAKAIGISIRKCFNKI